MTLAFLVRRWGVLVLGVVSLLVGFAILFSHTTIIFGWTAYPPVSDMAFYTGSPAAYSATGSAARLAANRHASFNGQIAIALGLVLVAGWIGFALARRRRIRPAA